MSSETGETGGQEFKAESSTSTRIPVHILTGFLGSGKTTLLNRALQSGFGPGTAVIVNEFGDIGLDQLFVQGHCEETIVLKNGCVCCTIRTDLASTLLQLLARSPEAEPLRRIVIETSGVSDPLPILHTLRSDFNLRTRFCAGSVVCTMGASDTFPLNDRWPGVSQITAADAIVVTKRDLVGPEAADAAQVSIAALNPLAEIVPCEGPDLVRWLFRRESASGYSPRELRMESSVQPATVAHPHGVRSIAIRAAAPPSWSQFAVWLTRLVFLHGDRILRTKGVLFDSEREVWIGIHGVRRFFHPPVHLALPVPPADGACLVFITEQLDPALIERSYRRMAHASQALPERAGSNA